MTTTFSRQTFWVVFSNTDLTEGRGHDYPIAVCATAATSRRLAKGCYVMGSDGPIKEIDAVMLPGGLGGVWYMPISAVHIVAATAEDAAAQAVIDEGLSAIAKAKECGLTDDDIKAIQGAK